MSRHRNPHGPQRPGNLSDADYEIFRKGYNAGYRAGSRRDAVDRLTAENINLRQQINVYQLRTPALAR